MAKRIITAIDVGTTKVATIMANIKAQDDECIFAYGGTDFDPLDDGPLRSIINMTVFLGIDIGKFWNKNCAEMQIIKPGIV